MRHEIHRIELPTMFAMGTVNAYLIMGQYNTLVDCGEKSDKVWKVLLKGLADLGLSIGDIDKLIITHAHVDHMGMANKVVSESGAKVYVSDLVYNWAVDLQINWDRRNDIITSTFNRELSENKMKYFSDNILNFFTKVRDYWDNIEREYVEVFSIDSSVDISGTLYQSLHCPGHTINQTCFFNEQNGDFLAADMLLKITPAPVIDFDPDAPLQRVPGMNQLLESFEMLKNIKIRTIYPGHYEIMQGHLALIERQMLRIQKRKNQCLDLISKGVNTYLDIFNALYKHNINFPGLTMTLGYLDLLLNEDKIVREQTEDGGLYRVN